MEKKIGRTSFTERGYLEFLKLPKSKQIEKIRNGLSPKSTKEAEQLLKDIPHGNIVGRNEPKASPDHGIATSGGNGGHNPLKPKADKGGKKGGIPERRTT